MISNKLFILCGFAFVLIGMAVDAYDYEEGDSGDAGSDDGSIDESYGAVGDGGGGGGGGDYETDGGDGGGDGGDYAAAADSGEADYAAASQTIPQVIHPKFNRQKRSLNTDDSKRVLRRVRRGGHGRVGPVYTYQKTDHHANFKWGNY